jgi:hypothetical protein
VRAGLRLAAWAAVGGFALGVVLLWQHAGQGAAERARGAALFDGRTPLAGRVVGHAVALPPAATRCANCHEQANATPSAPGAASAPFATVLDGAGLGSMRVRRGGPASRYDAASLCGVLRSGTDPAHVMISTTMPRYDITDAQCLELLAFLAAR